jgi:hypothetical protein
MRMSIEHDDRRSRLVTSAITGASAGASVGTIIGPVGTLIGSLVGLIGVPILLNVLDHRAPPSRDDQVHSTLG